MRWMSSKLHRKLFKLTSHLHFAVSTGRLHKAQMKAKPLSYSPLHVQIRRILLDSKLFIPPSSLLWLWKEAVADERASQEQKEIYAWDENSCKKLSISLCKLFKGSWSRNFVGRGEGRVGWGSACGRKLLKFMLRKTTPTRKWEWNAEKQSASELLEAAKRGWNFSEQELVRN